MNEQMELLESYKTILTNVLIDLRCIPETGDPEVDSYIDSSIKEITSVLKGE